MEPGKMPNITLSMQKDEQERLKRSAKKLRQSVSQHVLYLLDEYERQKEGQTLDSLFENKGKKPKKSLVDMAQDLLQNKDKVK